MALSNKERVRKGMDELVAGLVPFVERELKAKLGGYWVEDVTSRSRGIRVEKDGDGRRVRVIGIEHPLGSGCRVEAEHDPVDR